MNKYLEKVGMALALYKDPKSKKQSWIREGQPVPKGFILLKKTYKKSNASKNVVKKPKAGPAGFGLKKTAVDAELESKFQPDLSPAEMAHLGVMVRPESKYFPGPVTDNFFGMDAGLKEWPAKWLNDEAPKGWLQWYEGWDRGERTPDDERQIKRWLSFKARMMGGLKKADPSLSNLFVRQKQRQSLLNWGVFPGVDKAKALEAGNVNKYLEKIAEMSDE